MQQLNLEQINKKDLKIYKSHLRKFNKTYTRQIDLIAEVVFTPIAGGEFFQLLLLAHNSELWVQKPLCCFTPEYQSYMYWVWHMLPLNTVHDIERVKKDSDMYMLIYLSCEDKEYIEELRKWKTAAIKTPAFESIRNFSKNKKDIWHRSMTDDLSTCTEYYDIIIDYFNPSENYNELCKLLKMEPDIEFYNWAWIGYLTWQKVFLKSDNSKNKINKTIKYLKEELPKGYRTWTYKNF